MSKPVLDDDGFDLKPKQLSEDAWLYEGKRGLTVVIHARGTLQSIIGTADIPWSKLRPSIERWQNAKRRKRR